jgi:feruloyl-CoA synthase
MVAYAMLSGWEVFMGRVTADPVAVPYCPCPLPSTDVDLIKRIDGTLVLLSKIKFERTSGTICSYVREWADSAPDRLFLAQRNGDQGWQQITYGEFWLLVQSVGQALLDRGGKAGDALAILSGNSIEHAVVMFGAMSIGLQVVPISPNYSVMPGGLKRIEEIAKVLSPKFVFAQKAEPYTRARSIPAFAKAEWFTAEPASEAIQLSKLYGVVPGPEFEASYQAIRAETVGKVLFTSGSTGTPKGVINTHGMMWHQVHMGPQVMPVSQPPVQLEWLPWHHTMGGNVILHGILRDGGSLYIDNGRPTPDAFHQTVTNLKEVSPTASFNVPGGYALLCSALAKDPALKAKFFHRLERITFAGAAISAPVMARLQELAVEARGERIPILSGYGSTETAPTICMSYRPCEEPGEVGLPAPGVELKLIPTTMGAYEARVRGPNVMPGYLGLPEISAAAFDEEGYYRVGDTLEFVDSANPGRGLKFSGRLSESFKMGNGTWVLVGNLRSKILNSMGGILLDLVIGGENRDALVALVWLNPDRAIEHVAGPSGDATVECMATDSGIHAYIREVLQRHNQVTGTSERISAVGIEIDLPSLALGETTDKAYINQRAVLKNRSDRINQLYDGPISPRDIRLH